MTSVINTNVHSLSSQRNLSVSQQSVQTSFQRLASGLRVNSAKDDSAGLAVSTRMTAQIRGSAIAERNINDGISALQVADGALAQATEMLQRIRELTIQQENSTNSTADVGYLHNEVMMLCDNFSDVFRYTEFNGAKLLTQNGTIGLNFDTWKSDLQIGANKGDTLTISVFPNARVDVWGDPIDYPFGSVNYINGMSSMVWIDADLDTISKARANIGAQLNRLDAIVSGLQVSGEGLQAARSRIVDADYAAETSHLTKSQILQQSGNAMLAQANAVPQQVLKLLPQ